MEFHQGSLRDELPARLLLWLEPLDSGGFFEAYLRLARWLEPLGWAYFSRSI
ncbi:hypothetical protein ACFPYJ_20445 [Paenibacillus solisilvae]|uniref:Uncharacterized protein n=1 Tax=Paenibacillus solisilvae TaxID=2486751 RepID=A0ABW0W1W0_9BACL